MRTNPKPKTPSPAVGYHADPGRRLLTADEVAERLGCSIHALVKWRISGRGPTFRLIGNRVRYLAADVEAFVDASARTSTSARG